MKIVCDSNVFGNMARGTHPPQDDIQYCPTELSMYEWSTSANCAHDPQMFQKTIRFLLSYKENALRLDPIDYVLSHQYKEYPITEGTFEVIVAGFEAVDTSVFEKKHDEEFEQQLITLCKEKRKPMRDCADFSNGVLSSIQSKSIDDLYNYSNAVKELFKGQVKWHVQNKGVSYSVDWELFDWNQIELFLAVSESYLKYLETTLGKRVRPNDFIDWWNILYVSPKDKYLSYDSKFLSKLNLDSELIKKYFLDI